MGARPPEVASAEQERRRRVMFLVLLAALVLLLIVAFSVCNGGDDDDESASAASQTPATTTQTPATTSGATVTSATSSAPGATTAATVAATTTTTAAVATTVDPFAVFNVTEPRDVSVEWTCDTPGVMGSGVFGTACMTQSRDPVFVQSNFVMTIDYTTDADGTLVGMAVRSRSYGPNCTWDDPVDVEPKGAPIVDGKAIHSGVFIGDGRCEGVQWLWESTWDVEAYTILMTGVLEPIA